MIDGYDSGLRSFLADVQRAGQRTADASAQLSSGLRVQKASDDPGALSELLQTRAAQASDAAVSSSLGRVSAEVNTAQSALQDVVQLVEQARVAAVQGGNLNAGDSTRAVLANQVGAALEGIVHLSATQVDGRYIFSGDKDSQPPYTVDLTQTTPVTAYAGSATATRQVLDSDGSLISISRTAQQILEGAGPSDNVLTALTSLRTALLNNDAAGITTSLGNLQTASDHLNGELSTYGVIQQRVQAATDVTASHKPQQAARLSALEDADVTASALELQQSQLQQQAALAARAQLQHKSLFDYLG